MNNDLIQQRADELDAAIARDGAKLLIYVENFESGPDCELIGNREGYLRAGIELLRAAVVPLRPGYSITPISIDYLIPTRGSLRVRRLTRLEDPEGAVPPLEVKTWTNAIAPIGCLALFLILALCAFLGFIDIVGWFARR